MKAKEKATGKIFKVHAISLDKREICTLQKSPLWTPKGTEQKTYKIWGYTKDFVIIK
jgi:hypothetical protein